MDRQIQLRYDPWKSMVTLEVQGDSKSSFPLSEDETTRGEQVEQVLAELRRALKGERISTLY